VLQRSFREPTNVRGSAISALVTKHETTVTPILFKLSKFGSGSPSVGSPSDTTRSTCCVSTAFSDLDPRGFGSEVDLLLGADSRSDSRSKRATSSLLAETIGVDPNINGSKSLNLAPPAPSNSSTNS